LSESIFLKYGVQIFRDPFGYIIEFEYAGHGGGIMRRRIKKADAELAMSGPSGAAEVLEGIGRRENL
jgi:hypothetical protein